MRSFSFPWARWRARSTGSLLPPPAVLRHAAPSATAGSSEGAVCECGRACLPASQGVAVGYGGSEGGSRLRHASPPGTYWVSLPRGLDWGVVVRVS